MTALFAKVLSIVWALIFCTICGLLLASSLVVMQWISFKFGLPLTDSGEAFSPSFWSDFFKVASGAGAIFFCVLFREFWEEGITINK